jgi:glycosyltransferase involved in cell wall biosynthesis
VKVSIVVTVYSETFSLAETVKRLMEHDRGYIFEIILVVSPKSSQECFTVCSDLAQQCSIIKVHTQKNNPGLGWAIREGMELAKGDYVVLMSADLETEPEAADRMIRKIEETGCDAVIGNRWLRDGGFSKYDRTKLVLNYIFQKVFKILFMTRLGDLTYGYKVLSKDICDNIKWEGTMHEICIETTVKPIKGRYHIEQIPTVWIGRAEGESKNSFFRNFRYVAMAFKVLLSSRNRFQVHPK